MVGQDPSCTYVTHGWGVHDERWVSALAINGFDVYSLSCGRDQVEQEDLPDAIEDYPGVVLAGPLTTIASHLVGIERPVVDLSWGFDLYALARDASKAGWLKQMKGLIVDSEATLRIARDLGVSDSKILTMPWGVDLDRFTPDPPLTETPSSGCPLDLITVLSLRALEPIYRVQDIIEAFARLARHDRRLRLVIGNDGSEKRSLVRLTQDLRITRSVSFIGHVAEANLPPILRKASIYVTASEVDGTSVTLLQAMACGTPVVASDTPGNRPCVIPGKTGHTFLTADPESLTAALSKSIEAIESQESEAMTQAAWQRVAASADWKRNIRQLGRLMHSAADA